MKFRIARTSGRGNNERPCTEAIYRHTGEGKDTYDWFVEFSDLDELTDFCAKYGDVIVKSPVDGGDWCVEVYDDYRE